MGTDIAFQWGSDDPVVGQLVRGGVALVLEALGDGTDTTSATRTDGFSHVRKQRLHAAGLCLIRYKEAFTRADWDVVDRIVRNLPGGEGEREGERGSDGGGAGFRGGGGLDGAACQRGRGEGEGCPTCEEGEGEVVMGGTGGEREREGGNGPKSCEWCRITRTPLWRNGPPGRKVLCNACGIRWYKLKKALSFVLARGCPPQKSPSANLKLPRGNHHADTHPPQKSLSPSVSLSPASSPSSPSPSPSPSPTLSSISPSTVSGPLSSSPSLSLSPPPSLSPPLSLATSPSLSPPAPQSLPSCQLAKWNKRRRSSPPSWATEDEGYSVKNTVRMAGITKRSRNCVTKNSVGRIWGDREREREELSVSDSGDENNGTSSGDSCVTRRERGGRTTSPTWNSCYVVSRGEEERERETQVVMAGTKEEEAEGEVEEEMEEEEEEGRSEGVEREEGESMQKEEAAKLLMMLRMGRGNFDWTAVKC